MPTNEYTWRQLFNEWIPKNHWILIPEGITKCTDTWCSGTLYHYKVANTSSMCQFHVLPVVFNDEYWLPHLNGNYLDSDNQTHLLLDCVRAAEGLVCGQTSRIWEPCFLERSINYC